MYILRKSVLVAFLFVVGAASIVKADQVYVEGANDNFGLLNPQTGAYTLIGVTSERIGGMGFVANGTLYGVGDNAVLYQINPTTGDLTTIGNTGLNLSAGQWGMGTTQDGTLYIQNQRELYTIAPSNAQVTLVGNTGVDSDSAPAGDAAGNLYNGQGDSGTGFYKIDRTTGLASLLGNASYGKVYGFAFTDNTMYAINYTGSTYTMNLTNGASTLLSSYNISTVGNVYSATALIAAPETSTLAVGALAGAMASIGWLCRRRS